MEIGEKIKLVSVLNRLIREGELVVSDLKTGRLFSGEAIRIVHMKGDVIHICLSESIYFKERKNRKRKG